MHIFCSGIGGIGLSAYAAHMRARGHTVSGSDRGTSDITEDLIGQGIGVTAVQDGSGLPQSLDLLVYSEAIPEQAPERREAAKRGVRQISYFAALGELTAGKDVVCIAGTHGKSSTTAMAAKVFIDAGRDPSIVVGTKMQELGGRNWRAGSDLWIVEACEYRRSFLHLRPRTILLTNADGDHFDAFRDLDDYEEAFVSFVRSLPEDGRVISHGKDARLVSIVSRADRTFVDVDAEPLPILGSPGVHMQKNAQLVLGLAKQYGLDRRQVLASLAAFQGTWRRMERKGTTAGGVTVIDDYAHHPAEIRATLAAMRQAYPGKRIICVFQPHTHDRTIKLWKEFALAFRDADMLIVPNVYDARPDRDSALVNLPDFLRDIGAGSVIQTVEGLSLEHTEHLLRTSILQRGDVLVVMGAGNITGLATRMMK